MSTDSATEPQPVELSTDQPQKLPIEESLIYSIRNRGGWLTYSTNNQDAFLNEVQRRRDAGEDPADLNFEGGDPDEMLRAREEAEAAAVQAQQDTQAATTTRIADIKPQIDARAQELKDSPNKLYRAVAKVEFRMRGLIQDDDPV